MVQHSGQSRLLRKPLASTLVLMDLVTGSLYLLLSQMCPDWISLLCLLSMFTHISMGQVTEYNWCLLDLELSSQNLHLHYYLTEAQAFPSNPPSTLLTSVLEIR